MLLGLALVLASCGGGSSSGGGDSTPAPTVTIGASSMSITAGSSSTLTVAASNATQVVLTDNIGDPPYTFSAATGGTDVVTPKTTATYTATATGANGQTATNTVTVTVTTPPPNPTVTLSVTPNAALTGAPITLSWNSSNALSVVILDASGGGPGGVQPNMPGSVTLPSSQTTTYTATAYPEAGNTNQATATATVTVNPITSFAGMAEDSTNQGETDIDPNGAIGTKQFMEYVNTEYQGYAKTPPYAPVWTASDGSSSPQPIGTPWQNLPKPFCSGTNIQLDVQIIFDRLASRWVIAGKTTLEDHYYFCIAVSNTDDLTSPSFAWNAYYFSLDSALGSDASGVYLPDWPKIGTWPDAYYVTMDMEDVLTSQELGVAVCAFDRADLLVPGNTILTPQCFKDQNAARISTGIYLAHSLIPADVDGTTPPPVGRDEFLVSIENPLLVGNPLPTTSNTVNLWDFHVDWTNPSLSTFTQSTLSVPNYTPGCYDSSGPALTNCIPEPAAGGGAQKVDSVGDRFMPRFSYRNFATAAVPYESFLISSTVQTGLGMGQDSTQTGILWYELRGSGTPAVNQQGLISPDNNFFRFLPSIAQDHVGNAAVGYSISNTFTDPGIDLSFWNLPGSSAPTEVTILNGAGEQVNPEPQGYGQWGSYSSMTVDPVDDCTFWYINEYWPNDTDWATNIAYFQIPGCQ